ncbi:acyl-CoA dehydrogenase [Advenella kashmirensis W13003]|uniref:3-methylmercaptopropionyl-CoA dehydrogenase n=1 Tax=Advenella kashmirensis W13003 TaxID=1424334 RepID=V8QSJ0_9BURK|nr:acyl-CoA dehydrogenase [Advenella kashmirensis]ETF02290.1 acyl-CoA dehydrogenase [Advenella kashmirensis W13003]
MTYKAPLDDIFFNLKDMGLLEQVLTLPGYEEISDDIVDAVLHENAKFVQEVVAPTNKEGDQQGAKWDNGQVTTPASFAQAFKAFGEGGWQGLQHSPELGGQGFPKLISAAISENLNAANLSFALCPLLTDGFIEAVTQAGSETLQKTFVPPMLEGRWTGTMNLTEPQAGSDLALLTTKAIAQDDGTYRISGQKIFITYGEHDLAENIVHLVLARTPDAPKGVKGISLFVVPKFLVNEDGTLGKRNDVWCASVEEKLGIHGSPTAVLLYGADKGEVGEGAIGYLVGQENFGLQYMFIMMNAARYNVGIQGISVSERALQQATAYAADRVQGNLLEGSPGPVTIDHHPDVQRLLMTMRGLTEGARAIALYAAMCNDVAHQHADEKTRKQHLAQYEYLVPIVKAFSTENAVEVASLGVQVHGGMGYIEETGAAQYYRDARILPIYEGTTAIQANDFIGRKTLRDGGEVSRGFIAAMCDTVNALNQHQDDAALAFIGAQLEIAVQAYQNALDATLEFAGKGNLRSAFAGSVPFLMLAGYVHAGWHLANAALKSRAGTSDIGRQKIATAVFYAAHLLPKSLALSSAVKAGDQVQEAFSAVFS